MHAVHKFTTCTAVSHLHACVLFLPGPLQFFILAAIEGQPFRDLDGFRRTELLFCKSTLLAFQVRSFNLTHVPMSGVKWGVITAENQRAGFCQIFYSKARMLFQHDLVWSFVDSE